LTAFSTAKKAPSPSISQASKPKIYLKTVFFTFIQSPVHDTLVLPCLVVSQLALKFEGASNLYRFIDSGHNL
jgi:hypothetical protein